MNLGSKTPYNRLRRTFFAIISIFLIGQSAGRAMVINLTWDSSITSLGNATQVEAAITLGAQALEALYTNAITINITAYFYPGISLGESITFETGNPSYAQVTNYLRAARTTLDDSNSVASLPVADPTGGAAPWWLPTAEARTFAAVLGAPVFGVVANDTSQDGSVYFLSTATYTLNPTNRAVAGESDLTSVAEHEISEVMGRGVGLHIVTSTSTNGFIPYDLFRFTNSAARNLTTNAANPYFSVDNGVTPLAYFNPDLSVGDIQDWQMHNPADSFDYSLTEGQEGYLSYADLAALDILGYSLNFRPPKLSAHHLANGAMSLTFTNVTGLNFSILASTNIATSINNWTDLGVPKETSVGNYQFVDSTTNKARFYRARLN